MPDVERMNVYLPKDLAQKVHEAVKSGEFGMHCDVIRTAIEKWAEDRATAPVPVSVDA